MRLFFAVPVPLEISAQFAELQKKLRGNWRAVRPDQMHITLAYLPNVAPEGLRVLRTMARQLVSEQESFSVRLRGTGYFPNEGSPRVWFVKVESAELETLTERLRTELLNLGAPFDDKPFKAHVTLARKKGPAPRVPPKVFDISWTVSRLELMKSVLHKSGPEHERIGHFDLLPLTSQMNELQGEQDD